MISLSRRRVILLAVVLLFLITLVVVAHTGSYDAEVLRYVSEKINRPSEDARKADDDKKCQDIIAIESYPFANLSQTINVSNNKMIYDAKGPKGSQIAILTATDGRGHNGGIGNLTEMIMENRNEYAKQHGYIHHFVNITKYDLRDVSPVWKKLPAVVETFDLFPNVQWVFWIDADAIIMTPTQDLQSLILSKEGMRKQLLPGASLITETKDDLDIHSPQNFDFEAVDLIIAQDWNGVNAGSFLLRRSHFTQWMVDIWADPLFMYSSFERFEQDALRHMLKHHATMRQHTGIARQRAINAYPDKANPDHADSDSQWQPGDLLVHFAGCWVYGTCQTSWDRLWPQRGRVP